MKNIIITTLVILSALFSIAAKALGANEIAPVFELPSNTGVVSLTQFKGKVVYVDFWASWCGPCKQSFPWLNEMQSKYGAKGFQVVGINVDVKTAEAKTFLNEVPAKFLVAFDDKGVTPKQFGIKGMPSSVLIDASGKVIFQHTGFRDADKAQLEQAIQQALSVK